MTKIDTETARYLGFEKWWGGHVNLNGEEIQFIVDELFIGNHLAEGRIKSSDGTAIDLRNIRTPIVVFCSKGRQHHAAPAGARMDTRPL
jgi:poly(3-hydroxyalkanoate) synthetase